MLEARSIQKRFGATVAVRNATFTAPDGSITGLLGPNGAGKTTTLRILSGLIRPDHGEVFADGREIFRDRNGIRRTLGVLPDACGLYTRLTARENIRYFGRLQGSGGPGLESAIERLVRVLDLAAVADRRVLGFSQGERMKVALARALVHDPRNVLLDEPTKSLDVMSVRSIRRLLLRLRDEGRCVILSIHIMQEVEALCDRIVVIAGGHVAAEGSPGEIAKAAGRDDLEEAFVRLAGSVEG
jgi:sodium transport system ATP-binding protein